MKYIITALIILGSCAMISLFFYNIFGYADEFNKGKAEGIKIGFNNGLNAQKTAIERQCDSCYSAGAAYGIRACTKIFEQKTKGYHLEPNE